MPRGTEGESSEVCQIGTRMTTGPDPEQVHVAPGLAGGPGSPERRAGPDHGKGGPEEQCEGAGVGAFKTRVLSKPGS